MAKTFNPTRIAHRIRQSQDITFEILAKECGMSLKPFHQQLKVRLGISEYNKLVKREQQNHSKSTAVAFQPSAQAIKSELERRTSRRADLVVAYDNAVSAANESFAVLSRLRDELNKAQDCYDTAKSTLNELQAETKLNEENIARLELQLENLTKRIYFADYDGPIKEGYIKAGAPREHLYPVSDVNPQAFTSDVSFAAVIQAVNDVNFALVYMKDHPDNVVEVICGPISTVIWESARPLVT